MDAHGHVTPSGDLSLNLVRGARKATTLPSPVSVDAAVRNPALLLPPLSRPDDPSFRQIIEHGLPHKGLHPEVYAWRVKNAPRIIRQASKLAVMRAAQKYSEMPFMYGALWLTLYRGNGDVLDYGLAGLRVVTTAGVTFICADIAGGASDSNLFKYHGFGTGTTAEASGDTALVTELTTQYASDSTRPTGSQSSSTNTYTTVGTVSPDSGGTIAITEHGIFSATSGTTLLDRTVFSAVNTVAASDSLQATYVLTLPAGS